MTTFPDISPVPRAVVVLAAATLLATTTLLSGCASGSGVFGAPGSGQAAGAASGPAGEQAGPGAGEAPAEAPGATAGTTSEPAGAPAGTDEQAAAVGPDGPDTDAPDPDGPRPDAARPADTSAVGQEDPAPGLDLSARSATDPASPWVVVNKRTPLDPVDHEPDLTTVRGYLVRPDVAPDLTALLAAADAEGVRLTLRSAYRGYAKQAAVYEGWVAQLGAAQADAVSARPGHSEHQTGLAVDVGGTTRPECDFEPCFGRTQEGRWVAEHATTYGFLVRYTSQNSAVTGYAPEAWHLRWVGRDLSAYLDDAGITTLEEAFDVPSGGYAR
ncbi:D-alanyl-D-alanine carboxypeptidase family protein [Promicromonospora sukumoe]|uniref:M15 family metallopeptidase n=1 Tax=Promicromonospora sukumoe TaxID=88382 RepID=UPI0037C86B2E